MDRASAQDRARKGNSLCSRGLGGPAVIEDGEAGFNVDGDQVFPNPEWPAGKREADEQIAMGRGTVHVSGEAMFAYLKNLRVADGLS